MKLHGFGIFALLISVPAVAGPPLGKKPFSFTYETCNKSNGYLEKLAKRAVGSLKTSREIRMESQYEETGGRMPGNTCTVGEDATFFTHIDYLIGNWAAAGGVRSQDAACTYLAMKGFSSISYYECRGGVAYKRSAAPCLSKDYVQASVRSLELTSYCAGQDPRDMFMLFNQESGLHPSVVSGSGAAGAAQLTDVALAEIERVETTIGAGGRAEIEAINSRIAKDPICEKLRPFAKRYSKRPKTDCDLMSPPNAPMSSLVLGMKLYALQKAMFKQKIGDWNRKSKKKRFSPDDVERIASEIAMYSYNMGRTGISGPLEAFMRSAPAHVAVSASQFGLSFNRYLSMNYSSGARREEVSNHVYSNDPERGIVNKLNNIEKQVGEKCFEPTFGQG